MNDHLYITAEDELEPGSEYLLPPTKHQSAYSTSIGSTTRSKTPVHINRGHFVKEKYRERLRENGQEEIGYL